MIEMSVITSMMFELIKFDFKIKDFTFNRKIVNFKQIWKILIFFSFYILTKFLNSNIFFKYYF